MLPSFIFSCTPSNYLSKCLTDYTVHYPLKFYTNTYKSLRTKRPTFQYHRPLPIRPHCYNEKTSPTYKIKPIMFITVVNFPNNRITRLHTVGFNIFFRPSSTVQFRSPILFSNLFHALMLPLLKSRFTPSWKLCLGKSRLSSMFPGPPPYSLGGGGGRGQGSNGKDKPIPLNVNQDITQNKVTLHDTLYTPHCHQPHLFTVTLRAQTSVLQGAL